MSAPRAESMESHWPIVLIEGVLVFGGALLFGWWQLRSIKRDRQKAAQQKAAREKSAQAPVRPGAAQDEARTDDRRP